MSKAIILEGPSGVGKSTIAQLISKHHNYKHCDIDEFKWIFSHERSKERTKIGEYLGFIYALELIKRKHNLIIEALPEVYIKKLLPLLKKYKYEILKICLKASLSQYIKNNSQRKRKGYAPEVIREVYSKLSVSKGEPIDITGKTPFQAYNTIKKKFFNIIFSV